MIIRKINQPTDLFRFKDEDIIGVTDTLMFYFMRNRNIKKIDREHALKLTKLSEEKFQTIVNTTIGR